jgi:hypothetical protein
MAAIDTAAAPPVATVRANAVSIPPNPRPESAMDENLVPVTLFVCITYAIKLLIDARVRILLLRSSPSDDQVGNLIKLEEERSRQSSLRTGTTLLTVALGFGLIEVFGIREITPGAIALLAGATGLGNFAFYFLARRF